MRVDPENPPYAVLRRLLRSAYDAKSLARLAEQAPFGDLRYRFGPGHGLDDMIDEVLEFCRVRIYWEELLDAVAGDAPRAYNQVAAQRGWPLVEEASPPAAPRETPATPPTDLRRALEMAYRTLSILEEQAAGYTALTIPAHLRIELEEQRRKVADLEARLR